MEVISGKKGLLEPMAELLLSNDIRDKRRTWKVYNALSSNFHWSQIRFDFVGKCHGFIFIIFPSYSCKGTANPFEEIAIVEIFKAHPFCRYMMVTYCLGLIKSLKSPFFGLYGQTNFSVALKMLQMLGIEIGVEATQCKQGFFSNGKVQAPHPDGVEFSRLFTKVQETQFSTYLALFELIPEPCQPFRGGSS
jgi:hypothetical protein